MREAMAPHRGGVPEIVVEFECRGQSYRLRKAFRRAGVSLESGGQRLQDDAAERRLQELLQFERRQARTARPENAGVQALFWVDQATAFRDFDCIAGGRERLTAAIAAEVGTVAGGEGARRLLALARERAAAFYTAGRQQETGALKVASEQLKVLEAEHLALDGRRRDFDARVDRLARLRDERRRLIEQDQAGRARERCEVGRKRLAELADLERRCALAAEALKSAAAELARVEAQHRMRDDLMAEADRLETGARELAGRLEAMEQELGVLRQAMESGTRAEMEASAAAAAAERAASTLRDRLARARLTQEIERLGASGGQLPRCPGPAAAGAGRMVEHRGHARALEDGARAPSSLADSGRARGHGRDAPGFPARGRPHGQCRGSGSAMRASRCGSCGRP